VIHRVLAHVHETSGWEQGGVLCVQAFDTDLDGSLIYHGDDSVCTLSLMRACLNQGASFGKKQKLDANAKLCIPFVRVLLDTKEFPNHIIRNKALAGQAAKYKG